MGNQIFNHSNRILVLNWFKISSKHKYYSKIRMANKIHTPPNRHPRTIIFHNCRDILIYLLTHRINSAYLHKIQGSFLKIMTYLLPVLLSRIQNNSNGIHNRKILSFKYLAMLSISLLSLLLSQYNHSNSNPYSFNPRKHTHLNRWIINNNNLSQVIQGTIV